MKPIDPTIGPSEVYRFAPGDGVRDTNTGEYATVLEVKTVGAFVAGSSTAAVIVYLHKEGIMQSMYKDVGFWERNGNYLVNLRRSNYTYDEINMVTGVEVEKLVSIFMATAGNE